MFEEKWKRDKHDATTNNNGNEEKEIDCKGYDDVKAAETSIAPQQWF